MGSPCQIAVSATHGRGRPSRYLMAQTPGSLPYRAAWQYNAMPRWERCMLVHRYIASSGVPHSTPYSSHWVWVGLEDGNGTALLLPSAGTLGRCAVPRAVNVLHQSGNAE